MRHARPRVQRPKLWAVAAEHTLLCMARASWNGATTAESDDIVVVEGNRYFPRTAVDETLLEPSATTTWCFWKGTATYFTVFVAGQRNPDAMWTYQKPFATARKITDRVAFWHGVNVAG